VAPAHYDADHEPQQAEGANKGKDEDHRSLLGGTYTTAPDRKEAIVLTVSLILALCALILAIASAVKPVPLWIAVVLLSILSLLHSIPLGR
jgi:hypothetical protein